MARRIRNTAFCSIFILVCVTSVEVAACPPPDFKKIASDLQKAETISEAIAIRQQALPYMCDIFDFDRLTDLEPSAPCSKCNSKPTFAYSSAIGEFLSRNITQFIEAIKLTDITNLFIFKLTKKISTDEEQMRLRWGLVSIISSCEDLLILTAPWKRDPSNYLTRELAHLYYRFEKSFCGKTN